MVCKVIDLKPNLILVTGRPARGILPALDVGNVVLYKKEDTMYVFDVGATDEQKKLVHRAIRKLRPFSTVTILSSHKHFEHTVNLGMLDEIDVPVKEHYISQFDAQALADPYGKTRQKWMRIIDEAYADANAVTQWFIKQYALVLMYCMLRSIGPFTMHKQPIKYFEHLDPHKIVLGAQTFDGWKFNEDVWVLVAGGHTPGSVMFYIPEHKLLFTGDETSAIFPKWHDANLARSYENIQKIKRVIQTGALDMFVEGHRFYPVFQQEEMLRFLDQKIEQHDRFDHVIKKVLAQMGDTIDFRKLFVQVRPYLPKKGKTLFDKMIVAQKLHQLSK